MDTIKINKQKTKLIAHRGLSGLETENSLAAFVAAGNRSYYGIECDVRLSLHNGFVISHDDSTRRITGEHKKISQMGTAEILSKKSKKIKKSNNGTCENAYCSLLDYLLVCKKYNKHCFIEIKVLLSKNLLQELITHCKINYNLNKVTFTSLYLQNLLILKKINNNLNLQLIVKNRISKNIEICIKNHLDINCRHNLIKLKHIEILHKNNLKINCWTVNKVSAANKLIENNVDYIITDILE